MNFNIFVLIATIIFYVIFRFYKYQVQNESNKKKSFLIYVLLIPGLLYLTKFMFNIQNDDVPSIQTDIKMGGAIEIPIQNNVDGLYSVDHNLAHSVAHSVAHNFTGNSVDIEFDPVLTIPYPESSIYLSSN
jgi:hypothetical protein